MHNALRERVLASLSDLAAARKAVASPALGPILPRVRTDFEDRIVELETSLSDRVRADVPLDQQAWVLFENDRQRCERLLLELLAFVQGVLLRSHSLDAGVCEMADALLAELNDRARLGWKSFSLVADGESFANLAELVRLRFPVTGIWDLPIAAHEFGHFAGEHLQPRNAATAYFPSYPAYVAEEKRRAEEENRPWGAREQTFLNEFFADAFATFALGPAYVRSCLHLRFNPFSGNDESDGVHPSFLRRAYLILKVLNVMAEKTPDYASIGADARSRWAAICGEAGGKAIETDKDLNQTARDFMHLLRDCAPHLECATWDRARVLSATLFSDHAGGLAPDDTISNVLNACWIARLSGNAAWPPDRISATALQACGACAVGAGAGG